MDNNKEKVWKVGALVGILLAVFLAVISIKAFKEIGYVGKNANMMNSISVNGKGEEVAVPDIATFSFTINEMGKTVSEAMDKASVKNNQAIKVLKDAGIDEKDIKTTSYNVNPHYEYEQPACTTLRCPPGKSVLTGYDVSQSTQVKVRDLDKAGSIFSSIGSTGVQNVDSLYFTIDDIDDVKAKARATAIVDAQSKAKELAKQLGVKIVKITSFYDSSGSPSPYGMFGDMVSAKVMSAPAAPEISPGEQKVISNVTITYEIK